MIARHESLIDKLSVVLLGIRAVANEIGFSPATAVTDT